MASVSQAKRERATCSGASGWSVFEKGKPCDARGRNAPFGLEIDLKKRLPKILQVMGKYRHDQGSGALPDPH